MRTTADTLRLVERAQYVWNGRNYCWYDAGWKGPLAPNLPGSVLGRLNTIDGKRALHPTNNARLNDVAKAGSPR